jgi:hypothetical protein
VAAPHSFSKYKLGYISSSIQKPKHSVNQSSVKNFGTMYASWAQYIATILLAHLRIFASGPSLSN